MFKAQRILLGMALMLSLPGVVAQAQQARPPLPTPTVNRPGPDRDESSERNPAEIKMEREMQKRQNKARQESLKKDTDKLLQLATELKSYVDKTDENMLSLEVMRKAEEIEKLARSVKDKMKGP